MVGQTSDSFRRRFSRLAVTNVLATLMVPLAGLIDVAFLGHLQDIRQLAGVALATVIFDTVYWVFGFLRMGTTGMTAQALGRSDMDEVRRVFLRAAAMALALGALIFASQWPLREGGFWLLQGTEGVEQAGRAYWESRIWAAPFAFFGFGEADLRFHPDIEGLKGGPILLGPLMTSGIRARLHHRLVLLTQASSGWTPTQSSSAWTHQAKANLRAGLSRSTALDVYGSMDMSEGTYAHGVDLYFYY